jgi:hypothetical protein
MKSSKKPGFFGGLNYYPLYPDLLRGGEADGRFLEQTKPTDYDYHMETQRFVLVSKWIVLVSLLLFLVLVPGWPAFGEEEYQLEAITSQDAFDFTTWEVNAALAKAEAILAGGSAFIDEQSRHDLVLTYLDLISQSNRLNWEIEQIYTDPDIINPEDVSMEQQTALAEVRREMERLQPLAEAVVQDQVAAMLAEEGLEMSGQTLPPVMMHMTPLPAIMIVSPRDRIEQVHQYSLVPGLSAADKDEMETAVYENADLSALVVPIGGLAVYPAMVMETSSIAWLSNVVSHEWTHHWLAPYPISLNYGRDPNVRTINETVASIVGAEIGEKVVARYYPEFAPPPPEPETETAVPPPDSEEPPAFDFRAEMAETRRVVDEMLADGDVDGAEAYMEAQRRIFVENGYHIRKLNQAFFAFYGAYADEPGAAGDDPIGPTLLALREKSDSLLDFLSKVTMIGSVEDLQQVAEKFGIQMPLATAEE